MNSRTIKFVSTAIISIPMILIAITGGTPAGATPITNDDAAATYKAKCAMCHGPTAAKAFDTAKPDEHHVNAILKGQKGEKPPYMPEYASKGITEEAAKALVAHMRALRSAGS